MTVQDWLDLMAEAGLPEQEWRLEEGPELYMQIRNRDGYCPLCALAAATEAVPTGMRESFTFALRTVFGSDVDLNAACLIAEAADFNIHSNMSLTHNLTRAALGELLGIRRELL